MRGQIADTPIARNVWRAMQREGFTNAVQLERAAGVTKGYVRDILRGKSNNPKSEDFAKVATALHCSVKELVNDPGAFPQKPRDDDTSYDDNEPDPGVKWTSPVREVDVYIGMGGGGLMDRERSIGTWQLPKDWLRSELRSRDLDLIRIVTLEGDSMAGTLEPGDKVIVDLGRTVPSPPGLFVLWDGLAQVAKRLEYIEGSEPARIRIISDNRVYGTYERTMEEVHIVGRIMGRWQRLS
jgi:transcriptional regulator with XRE-family HTH domain